MLTTLTMFWTILVGCGLPEGDSGQSGEESLGCLAVAEQDYALADATPLGFTGQELTDLAVGDHAAVLTWAAGGTTDLTVAVASDATTVQWRDMEWQDDGSGMETMEYDTSCSDVLALPVTVGFTTADGAFAESWSLELLASVATEAQTYTELDLDALAGTYAVTEVDPADYDQVRAFLTLLVATDGVSGVLDGQGEKVDGETASASHFDIATFE